MVLMALLRQYDNRLEFAEKINIEMITKVPKEKEKTGKIGYFENLFGIKNVLRDWELTSSRLGKCSKSNTLCNIN